MKILVIGPGTLSSYLAVRFAIYSRHEVCLLEKNIHAATNDNEIIVTDVENNKVYSTNKLKIYDDITRLTQADIIILASRISLNKNLLPHLSKLCSSETSVILLQNGLDFEKEIAQSIPGNRIYSGSCWIKVTNLTPNNLRHEFGNSAKLGRYSCDDHEIVLEPADLSIKAFLEEAGLQIELITNIKSVQLTKLALNVPLFVIAATKGKSYPEILHDAYLDKQRSELQEEIAQAATQIHSPVDLKFIESMIDKLRKLAIIPPDSRTQFAEMMKMELPSSAGSLLNLMHRNGIELKSLKKFHEKMFPNC